MEIILNRFIKTETSTISECSINGEHICFILEDKDRGLSQNMSLNEIQGIKIKGKTAIPTGKYQIDITLSFRFKKLLPILVNVPGFEGIRIHPGNTSVDTEGCLLPGTDYEPDKINNSRVAFNKLFELIQEATEDIWIEIK